MALLAHGGAEGRRVSRSRPKMPTFTYVHLLTDAHVCTCMSLTILFLFSPAATDTGYTASVAGPVGQGAELTYVDDRRHSSGIDAQSFAGPATQPTSPETSYSTCVGWVSVRGERSHVLPVLSQLKPRSGWPCEQPAHCSTQRCGSVTCQTVVMKGAPSFVLHNLETPQFCVCI